MCVLLLRESDSNGIVIFDHRAQFVLSATMVVMKDGILTRRMYSQAFFEVGEQAVSTGEQDVVVQTRPDVYTEPMSRLTNISVEPTFW